MNTFSFVIAFAAILATAFGNAIAPCDEPAQPALYSLSESEPTAKVSSSHGYSGHSGHSGYSGYSGLVYPQYPWQSLSSYSTGGLALNDGPLYAGSAIAYPSHLHRPAVASVSAAPLPSNVKGETVVHNPKPIVIRRPPTNVVIHHPPIVVKPASVAFHKPPAKVVRPVIVKNLPPNVHVEPVFKKVLGPVQRKVIVSQPPCDD